MTESTMPSRQTFGDRLRELRKAAGKTQREVAAAVAVDFTYLSKMEKPGGFIPAAKKIEEIAKFLGVTDIERADLFRLAAKIPEDVEQMLVQEPDVATFYRVVNRMDDAKRRAYFQNLVEQLERERQDDTNPEGQNSDDVS